jgi:hypothetical protein
MVCVARFRYEIPKKDLDNFITNANRYFPDIKWSVTCGDMTLSTSDLQSAIKRLAPSDDDIIVFETGRIWDGLSFRQAMPLMTTCEVSQELRQRLSRQLEIALDPWNYQNENVNQSIDWTTVPQLMTLLHEKQPLVRYIALPSCNMILYEPCQPNEQRGLSCIYIEKGAFTISYAPRITFDIDDGFSNYGQPVPKELTDAFDEWVRGGKVGPVLK